ncbi:septum formation inhibitor Maf [Kouleothrix aurantiaca]|uniref:dTTP/UTP pyrophosphatase n=1 Tax=Kouleothrix aurantiaca TaxID=186479 RepID=A0A0P9DNA0_9CHLR|nr:septum formation inhibitor Maf [Kouleothrix aurantiaca]
MAGSAPRLVLASASPRRRELLGWLGATFQAIATDGEEQDDAPPAELVAALPPCPVPLATHPTLLAWRKVQAACAEAPDSVIIGADTIVVLDGDVLGKPRDEDHARAMLARLAGRQHTVYTGLVVVRPGPAPEPPALALVASDVLIAPVRAETIAAYVATGEPMDKAGAYGIQGLGGQLVVSVSGSYTCVVGLPLVETYALLVQAGISALHEPADAYQRWLHAQGKEPLPCPPTFP